MKNLTQQQLVEGVMILFPSRQMLCDPIDVGGGAKGGDLFFAVIRDEKRKGFD